jgi:sarcosine oxidase subunit beta
MAETADVVVVGGGCLGTASALFLARKRAGRVLLLEQERVCSGITGRSSGIVRQSYVLADNARLATKGLRVFEQFDRAIGGDAGFRNVGLVWVGGPEMRATFDDLQQSMNEFGAESRYLVPEELRELAPGFQLEEGEFALWEPHGGYASPPHTVAAYARQARLAGAEIRERTRVTGLRRSENGLFSLATEQGTIETRVVVNATSGWSAKLLATLGVELPVKPYPVQVSHWLMPVETGPSLPVIGDWTTMAYLRPFPDRTLLVGATDEVYGKREADPERFDPFPSAESIRRDRERLVRRFPAFGPGTFKGGYAAFYDLTPDNQFILGEMQQVPGLYNLLGAGHAFKMAPAFGQLTAELVVDGRPSDPGIDLAPYRFERFAEGAVSGRATALASKSHGI